MANVGVSESSGSQTPVNMGLGSLIGLSAAGGKLKAKKGGVIVERGGFPADLFGGEPILTPEVFQSLGGLLETMPMGFAEEFGLGGGSSQLALQAMGQGQSEIDSLMAGLLGAGEVTDMAPITESAQHFLGREYMDIGEQMGAGGSFDTDIMGSKGRAAADVAAELGTLEFQAEEAAKQRQIDAVSPGLAGTAQRLSQVVDTFGSLFEQEAGLREAQRSETPGGRAAELLDWLASLNSTVGTQGEQESQSVNAGVCWCAAVYYGWFTPEWWNARRWIVEGWDTPAGRLFKAMYLRGGEVMAEVLRQRADLRERFRPVFAQFERLGRAMG